MEKLESEEMQEILEKMCSDYEKRKLQKLGANMQSIDAMKFSAAQLSELRLAL